MSIPYCFYESLSCQAEKEEVDARSIYEDPKIEQYRAEIKRLQESEAEIKALSKNYAALLKEKEDQISILNKENGSLKQNLDTTTASLNASRIENYIAAANGTNLHKGSSNQSPNRQQRLTGQAKTSYSGHQKQNGVVYTQNGNGISNGIAHLSDMQGNERLSSTIQYISSLYQHILQDCGPKGNWKKVV
ncbi:hypothetical protein ABKV19_006426 [Rosa sericea]